MTYLEKDYREIITKAVCGKGRKYSKEEHKVSPPNHPSSILGCWIINHLYHARHKSKDTVEVKGSYDINIWYSFNDNTKTEVVTERITYRDQIPLSIQDDHTIGDDHDVIAKVIQQPNCLECKIDKKGNIVLVEVEREFIVKIIGETKVFVRVDPEGHKDLDNDEDWDFEVSDDELKDVNPNFLDQNKQD